MHHTSHAGGPTERSYQRFTFLKARIPLAVHTLDLVNTPRARDSGLRRVSTVTKVIAGAGVAIAAAFAVHAADENPGRSNVRSRDGSATVDQSGVSSSAQPVPAVPTRGERVPHTRTGGS